MEENEGRQAKKSKVIRYKILKYTGISGLYRFFTRKHEASGYKLAIEEKSGFLVAHRSGTTDLQVIEHSFENDIFFSGVPEYTPSENDIMIDVGAHIGTFSMLASRKVPKGKVFAIEACRESYNYCLVNKKLNDLNNVETCNYALHDKEGTIKLNYDTEGWGHSITSVLTGEGEEVQAISMESFMSKYKIDQCNFIKFNCEGAEFPIILGTPISILAKFKFMLVLYHLDLAPESSLVQLENHFTNAGFKLRFSNVHPNGKRGWLIATKS